MDQVLQLEIEEGVAVLALNRPDSLNALNTQLMRELASAAAMLADDKDVRCVVLTGSGRAFCAGGDRNAINKAANENVKGTSTPRSTIDQRVRWLRKSAEASRLFHEMSKPTIAMINGACAGAGMSLAAACDFRFAARSAIFAPGFISIGMPGDYGGSWLWTRILGTARARQLYLLDRRRTAEEALAFGIVDDVFDDDVLQSGTMAIAAQLAGLEPASVAFAKANLNAALSESLAQSLDRESMHMIVARQALIEKRQRKAEESPGGSE